MSDKYIIRNCECKIKGKTTLCVRDVPYKKCENITDCIMKQIVKKCEFFQYNYLVNDGVQLLTTNILNSLDIQEVE